ncbi:MAG: hypothetical protein L0229_26165 [Blastocatellia bacterium]|nr:hypothetical protein [Blastocatellia bacterium]
MAQAVFVKYICNRINGLLIGTNPFFWKKREVQAMNAKFAAKDLPQHGMAIVQPFDPEFDAMALSMEEGQGVISDDEKPFSIIVKNENGEAVVGLRLRWEFERSDGRIIFHQRAFTVSMPFDTSPVSQNSNYIRKARLVIEPDSAEFFSLISSPLERRGLNIGAGAIGTGSGSIGSNSARRQDLEALRDSARRRDFEALQSHSRRATVNELNALLENSISVTVAIDGAFFEDGGFVGPDTTDFFAEMKAKQDARRDLLVEIERTAGLNKSDVFKQVEIIAQGGAQRDRAESRVALHYNISKQRYAQELLARRRVMGDERLLDFVREQLARVGSPLYKK